MKDKKIIPIPANFTSIKELAEKLKKKKEEGNSIVGIVLDDDSKETLNDKQKQKE